MIDFIVIVLLKSWHFRAHLALKYDTFDICNGTVCTSPACSYGVLLRWLQKQDDDEDKS